MKILFLTRFDFTENKNDGGLLAADRNYRILTSIYGADNVVLSILSPNIKENKENLYYFKAETNIISRYWNYLWLRDRISIKTEKQLVSFILNNNFDLIFYDGSTYGQIMKNKKIRNMKHIVFFHNIERQYTWEQVVKHSPLCVFRYIATRYNEKKMMKFSDQIICLNKRDESLLFQFYKRRAKLILPITFDDMEFTPLKDNAEGQKELLYVGSYLAHNYQGLIWFISEVMPYISAKLVIVGKGMENIGTKIQVPENVHIAGTVDSVEEFYLKADAMVMPIFMGGGMKVKTAEAMMYGKTIFASCEALEGYDVTDSVNVFECNNKEQFIENINKYFSNASISKYNQDVRDIFLNRYCTEKYISKVEEMISSITK